MEGFRNLVQSWWGKAFLFAVLVVFVVFAFGPQFLSTPGAQGEVADVNGHRIFARDVDLGVEQAKARYGNQVDPKILDQLVKRDDVFEGLVRQRVMIDVARDAGLVAPPAMVQEVIASIEAFKDEKGGFSQDLFLRLIQRNGFANAAVFHTRVEEDLLMSQLTGALRDSSFATKQDLELLTRMGEQKRDFSWVVIRNRDLASGVAVSDAEVQARYEASPAAWLTEEQFAVDYVLVDLEQYAASQAVTDADVRAKYDEMARRAQENAERRVAHILVRVDAGRDDASAKARAEEIVGRIAAGQTFAQVAGEYSDDTSTRTQGGDLGFLSQGVLDPALEKALATLRTGDVSTPVKAADGYHLLKILEVRGVDVPSFEQQKAQLAEGLKRDKAREKFESVVAELSNAVYEEDSLQAPAQKLGLLVQASPLFGRAGGPGVFANPKVIAEVISADVLEDGRNSGVVRPTDNQALVLHLKEHRKPQRRPLAEVASQVRAGLLQEKASAKAGEKAAALLKQVVAGTPLAEAAAGLVVEQAAGMKRAGAALPQELVQAGFAAKRPANSAVSAVVVDLAGGDKAVLVISNVVDGSLVGKEPESIASDRGQVANEFGRFDFTRFVAHQVANADIVRIRDGSNEGEKGVGDMLKELKQQAQSRRP